MPRVDLIQVRRGTVAVWAATNPILADGELGGETDTGKLKVGDGVTAWASLPYSGTTATATSGVRGVTIPAGSLDVWKAARNASATESAEIVCIGDSTTSCESTGTGGWVVKLRALSIAAGYTDGGRGTAPVLYDTAAMSGENLAMLVSNTGFGEPDSFDPFQSGLSTTIGNVITVQGKGTAFRLTYGKRTTSGRFSYAVDGGAAVTVDAEPPSGTSADVLAVTGLAEGTHQVVITNLGGGPVLPVPISSIGNTGAGQPTGFASGTTVYYVSTVVTPSGETVASAVVSITVAVGVATTSGTWFHPVTSTLTSFRLYRSTTGAAGSFGLIYTVAKSASSATSWSDDNTVAAGVAPPSTSTAGNNTARNRTAVATEFFRSAAGLVFQQNGGSGATFENFFSLAINSAEYRTQLLMGLRPGITGSANGTGWGMPEGSHPTNRKIRLAICVLGVNNQQGAVGTAESIGSLIEQQLALFCRMARAAGADPLVVIPHLNYATQTQTYGGTVRRAIKSTAVAHNCATVDFNEALGPINVGAALWSQGPHINQAGYDAEATFLWNNCLSLPLLPGSGGGSASSGVNGGTA